MQKYIELNSEKGEILLKKSQDENYCLDNLNKTIKRQLTEYTCSISSLSAISNAWYLANSLKMYDSGKLPFDEEVFTAKYYEMKPTSSERGLNIDELFSMITEIFPQEVRVKKILFSHDISSNKFKHDIIQSVSSSCQTVVIVNYLLNSICNEWLNFGHFSPISAYEKESDKILIADTYMPSFWVDVNDMYQAIDTLDSDSNHKRGYLLLEWQKQLND